MFFPPADNFNFQLYSGYAVLQGITR